MAKSPIRPGLRASRAVLSPSRSGQDLPSDLDSSPIISRSQKHLKAWINILFRRIRKLDLIHFIYVNYGWYFCKYEFLRHFSLYFTAGALISNIIFLHLYLMKVKVLPFRAEYWIIQKALNASLKIIYINYLSIFVVLCRNRLQSL